MNHSSSESLQPEPLERRLRLPPLALYIHIPWCVKKCPYCDFNSYAQHGELPVAEYVLALKNDLISQLPLIQGRSICSIFFGGGTPSLFPASGIADILSLVREHTHLDLNAEITLETNPGTAEYSRFDTLLESGVNRLSFGAQSFDDLQLATLGRIHNSSEIFRAIDKAKLAGYTNFNIDLMHCLPGQNASSALNDIETALSFEPTHLSWYQLTIEPNTEFYSQPPVLPEDDIQCDIYDRGRALLSSEGFHQYEVSAYAKHIDDNTVFASQHNLNYWRFGDYLAIGAGAHGKVTLLDKNQIYRFNRTRSPKDYIKKFTDQNHALSYVPDLRPIAQDELSLEFMMNSLRLLDGVDIELFSDRTGLDPERIEPKLEQLRHKDWLTRSTHRIQTTASGHYYLNDVLASFLDE